MTPAEMEWVKAAISDDTLVADLLITLHAPPPAPPLDWTVRQPRSKHLSAKLSHRSSPTTPLSRSFANSLSGGSGGAADEISARRNHPSSAARSKVNGESEKGGSKKTRKKKTLAELKVEESSLIKERRELKRELSAMRVNLENQRSTNENLKRIKIELQPVSDTEMLSESISGQTAFNPKFVLPDLNMPIEEDSCPDVVCAILPPAATCVPV